MAKKEAKSKTTKKVKKVVEEAPVEVKEFEEAAPIEAIEETPSKPEDMGSAEIEVMNGDPTVVVPVEEAAPVEEDTPSVEIKDIVVEGVEVKEIKNNFRNSFGYLWNGQEVDY